MNIAHHIKAEFQKLANPKKAMILSRFFKEKNFYGVMVPQTRALAKHFADRVMLPDIASLLATGKHEERLFALFVLVQHFQKSRLREDFGEQSKIVDFYLKHATHINNWDLVDSSAPYILGAYLFENPKKRKILFKLAKSRNFWKCRIAIVATQYFIKRGRFNETLKLATLLLKDSHDLIHKAVGWMLREVGKKDERALTMFLDKYAAAMPRTMLRYSIEQLFASQKKKYMA